MQLPYGEASVGVDIDFPSMQHIYGIPEHTTDLSLKTTYGANAHLKDPYRLYSLDVPGYEIDEPMALYGSIPVMLGHSKQQTVGVYYNNPTETFIDVENDQNGNKMTHWMSESGVLDLFLLPGPTAKSVIHQYTTLTGYAPMPPMFTLGYHQCRWSYMTQQDAMSVNDGFNKHNIPYDVLWLDIDHTHGKRYFTWDYSTFPKPLTMQKALSKQGRKMVTIIDPHIFVDPDYYIYREAKYYNLFIQNKDNGIFEGKCWPGLSSYIDFTNPSARSWWSSQYRFDKYKDSSIDLYTWNDMNEPAVFEGPEKTMRKDNQNYQGIEHREWHSLYGYYMQRATFEGQIQRMQVLKNSNASKDINRPFVLTRSFAAGSQKYGAMWTGDNTAEWSHLEASSKMLMSLNLAGLSFAGADIGGFFGNPNSELVTRWYQVAAYQPFMRGHAAQGTKRREPWLFGEPHTSLIRESIETRYSILPYLYTLFHDSHSKSVPVMRPLWVEYPKDSNLFGMDDQFLLGENYLVHPVTKPGVKSVNVYFPASSTWYNLKTSQQFVGGKNGLWAKESTPISYIPVYQRGGSVVPSKETKRSSSKLMKNDPITLSIALDKNQEAVGSIYIDDETTMHYKDNYNCIRSFQFKDNSIRAFSTTSNRYIPPNYVDRIVIYGLYHKPLQILVNATGRILLFSWEKATKKLMISGVKLKIAQDWELNIMY